VEKAIAARRSGIAVREIADPSLADAGIRGEVTCRMIGRQCSRTQVSDPTKEMTMNALASEFRDVLSGVHEPPCLSLYQPTHRRQPDRRQDSIRFGNLVKALEDTLRREYPARDVRPLLAPFHALAADSAFWNHGQDGLAVFGAAGMFRVYQLPRSVPERTVVADGFHIKPLLRIVQSADRFHILGLNRREACLFEGNRDAVTEIDLVPGAGRMVTDMPIGDVDPAVRAARVYDTTLGAPTTRLGTDATQDVVDHDTDQFFRIVDQTVLAHHSRPAGLPLVLAALPEYHHRFRAISQNPLLADVAIDVFPDAIPQDALRERAWRAMLPRYLQRLERLSDAFHVAKARNAGTDGLRRAAEAAVAGRVATLMVDADRIIAGRLDGRTGEITLADTDDRDVDDVLDDLGEQVLKAGGDVLVVPAERMPSSTGVAATYRY
jgi:hypothetical protein